MQEVSRVPSLSLVGLRLQSIDLLAKIVDFVSAGPLDLVRSNEGTEFFVDLGNCPAGYLQSLFRSLIGFALEGTDFHLELDLPALEFVDCFWNSFASHADTRMKLIIHILQNAKRSKKKRTLHTLHLPNRWRSRGVVGR